MLTVNTMSPFITAPSTLRALQTTFTLAVHHHAPDALVYALADALAELLPTVRDGRWSLAGDVWHLRPASCVGGFEIGQRVRVITRAGKVTVQIVAGTCTRLGSDDDDYDEIYLPESEVWKGSLDHELPAQNLASFRDAMVAIASHTQGACRASEAYVARRDAELLAAAERPFDVPVDMRVFGASS